MNPLCDCCAKVPLRDPKSATDSAKAWSLGSGLRIKKSGCPLCKVVVKAFQTHYQMDPRADGYPLSLYSDVSITWLTDGGPERRSSFGISAFRSLMHLEHHVPVWICVAPSMTDPQRPLARVLLSDGQCGIRHWTSPGLDRNLHANAL